MTEKNSKNRLFKLIREEKVILWAGAGLSMYAGFPNGKAFCKILIENLNEQEKAQIDLNSSLPKLSDDFNKIKNEDRKVLNKILFETFLKVPKSTDYHDKIAKIWHFKAFITTNYDRLFENSLKENCQVIIDSSQIPSLNYKIKQVYKIHGDLSKPETIILTDEDYKNYFIDNKDQTTYWTKIKDLIASNVILFIGYTLDDFNVFVQFEKISNQLTGLKNEYFLICPNLPEFQIKSLHKKGITYINSTGEKIIEGIKKNIEENFFSDYKNGITSIITADKYSELNNLNVGFSIKNAIQDFNIVDGKIIGELTIKGKENDDKHKQDLDFFQGKRFGNIILTKKQLTKLFFGVKNHKILDENDIKNIEFKSVPSAAYVGNVFFADKYKIENIKIVIFKSEFLAEIHIAINNNGGFKITLKEVDKMFISLERNNNVFNISDEIVILNAIKRIGNGMSFSFINLDGNILYSHTNELKVANFTDYAEKNLKLFYNLKTVENYFNVQFIEFDKYIKDEYGLDRTLNRLIQLTKSKYIQIISNDALELTLTPETTTNKIVLIDNLKLTIPSKEEEVLLFLGAKLNLGYQTIEIPTPKYENLEEVLGGNTNILKLKIGGKMILKYTKNPILISTE